MTRIIHYFVKDWGTNQYRNLKNKRIRQSKFRLEY